MGESRRLRVIVPFSEHHEKQGTYERIRFTKMKRYKGVVAQPITNIFDAKAL